MTPDQVPVYAPASDLTADRVPACEVDAEGRVGPDGSALVVDMAASGFVCSAGLGMLVRLSKRMHDRGGRLALARVQPPVTRLLKMVGLEGVLPSFPTVEAAVKHAAAPRAVRLS